MGFLAGTPRQGRIGVGHSTIRRHEAGPALDPSLAVQVVHEKIDEIERALRRSSASIKRVIGHAEPQR